MDIFGQGFFVILLPFLILVVGVIGFLGLRSKQITDPAELQDKINHLIDKIRKALFLDRLQK
jgi:hypothetical protein